VIVVKLGGSIAEGNDLSKWLAVLQRGVGRAVVVPGGGPFAETVRREQRRIGFGDGAAHRMALLAMEQMALLIADHLPVARLCRSVAEIHDALASAKLPVWMASTMALAERAIPESWDVTSDSLAAWLARRLAADRLVLVKSVAAPGTLDPERLAAEGKIDPAFPQFIAGVGCTLDWMGPDDEGRLGRLLAG
jgi:5-(aminomethyl)-3-furanmethanol phosphate kinase